MNEEEILKRITGLLEQGCTMLAQHHDCGAPLFRCKGKILCPVCSFGAEKRMDMQANEAESAASKPAEASKGAHEKDHDRGNEREKLSSSMPVIAQKNEPQKGDQAKHQSQEKRFLISGQDLAELITLDQAEIIASVKKDLSYKLKELSDNIVKEQDPSRLRAMLDCIEVALRILSVLNEEI